MFTKLIKSVLFCSSLSFLLLACKKNDNKGDAYSIKYTINCDGRFKGDLPKLEYKDASGTIQSETLSVNKEWIKEISVAKSTPIYARVTGTIDSGSVSLDLEAYKNGNLVEIDNLSRSSDSETPFELLQESVFDN